MDFFFFKFYPFIEGITHQKFSALYGGFNSKSPLVQAPSPVPSSDAAGKTQAFWLVRLTNALKAAAVSVPAWGSGF